MWYNQVVKVEKLVAMRKSNSNFFGLLGSAGVLLGLFLFFNLQISQTAAVTCFFDGGITLDTNTVNLSSQNTRVNFTIKVRTSTGTCDGFQIARDIFKIANNQETFIAHLGSQTVSAGSDRINFYWDAKNYQPGTYLLRVGMGNSTLDSQRINLTRTAAVVPNKEPSNSSQDSLPGYDLTIEGIGRIITGIACWTMSTILAVMVIALVIAGIRFYIGGAAGDVSKAKTNLLWVLVGIVIILATNVIIATVVYYLGGSYSALSCVGIGQDTTFPNLQQNRNTLCQNDYQCNTNAGEYCPINPDTGFGYCTGP